MLHVRLRAFVVCGFAVLVGCGGNTPALPLPPTAIPATATAVPATATPLVPTPAPTATPASTATPFPPTATPVPRATVTLVPRATATLASTPISRRPLGSPPSGWKTYAGNARLPFSVYY